MTQRSARSRRDAPGAAGSGTSAPSEAEVSGLDAVLRRLGRPTSRLSVAAGRFMVAPWVVLLAGLTVAEFFGVADRLWGPLAVVALACVVASLVLGVAALCVHARDPKLRGIAYAILAVVVSGAELGVLLYVYTSGFTGPHGRALRVRGRPVLARVRAGAPIDCASRDLEVVAVLGDGDRAALRDHWTLVAREEHASIAAFARLAVALCEHGAPRSLVDGARAAARQEADHAARCFALASAYARQELEPCALAVEDTGTPTLVTLAVEALVDGCLGEGASAAEAELLVRGGDTVAAVHDTLVVIARDEAGHAALSWAVLEWCLAVGGDPVRVAVKRALEALARRARPSGFAAPSGAQRRHGMATAAERAAAWQAAYDLTSTRASALLRVAVARAA